VAKDLFTRLLPARPFHWVKGRIFYGWWMVILGSLVNSIGAGILVHGFTIFFLPLKNEFQASSAAISLLYAAARLEGGFEGPLVGYLITKFGPRTMMFAGIMMTGGGLLLASTMRDYWTFFFVFVFIVYLGFNTGFYHPVSMVVNNWFIRRRGVAFSLISATAGLGGMVMAPLLSIIIATYGWRAGMVTGGLMILGINLPATFPIRRSPEVMGVYPDDEAPRDPLHRGLDPQRPDVRDEDFSVKEAIRTSAFWMLTAGISLRLFVTVALITHFVPILVWRGMSQTTGAYLVSLYALGTIFATLTMGWFGDRRSKALICSLGLVPMILVVSAMTLSPTTWVLYLYPIGLAVAMGTAAQNWALIGDFFGRRHYATVRGLMGVSYGTTSFLSPIYAGVVYDRTGSYTFVLISLSVILLITVCLFAKLRPPPSKRRSAAPPGRLNS